MGCERLEDHNVGSKYSQDMQASCYYFYQYILQGAVQIRVLELLSSYRALYSQNYRQQRPCSKNQQATGKAIFVNSGTNQAEITIVCPQQLKTDNWRLMYSQ